MSSHTGALKVQKSLLKHISLGLEKPILSINWLECTLASVVNEVSVVLGKLQAKVALEE